MSMQRPTQWSGGWGADDPVEIGFAWAAKDDGEFVERDGCGFAYRDLNVAEASNGALGVRHARVADTAVSDQWRALDVDFDFIFVLAGTATLENEDCDTVPLEPWSCAVQPGSYRYRITCASEDFTFVQVTAPASYAVAYRVAESLRGGDAPRHAPIYTHDGADQYTKGAGPREWFLYRDLHTTTVTEGRMHIHIVRATEPGPGTGWHYHTMAQWYMVIGGAAKARVEDGPCYEATDWNAMCIGRGPHMRHNVTKFSADYAVLEICAPAEYETIATEQPAGAANDD